MLQDLVDLIRGQGRRKRPLPLAGHSTGGLVIKYALIQALSGRGPMHAEVAEACFSLAFFGVPHYGSSILHGDAYRTAVETATGMKLYDGIRTALNPECRELFDDEARSFAPLASSLRRIWTFVEGVESKLKVLSGNTAGEEEMEVFLNIVDERSATLSTPRVRIGNKKVTIVNVTHAELARFGGVRDSPAYKKYIQDLRALIDGLGATPGQSGSWRENTLSDEVTAEVHLFYEVQAEEPDNIIKFSSVETPLSDLIRSGPMACLRRRLTKANYARTRLANGMHFGFSDVKFTEPMRSLRELNSDDADNADISASSSGL